MIKRSRLFWTTAYFKWFRSSTKVDVLSTLANWIWVSWYIDYIFYRITFKCFLLNYDRFGSFDAAIQIKSWMIFSNFVWNIQSFVFDTEYIFYGCILWIGIVVKNNQKSLRISVYCFIFRRILQLRAIL